MSKSKAVVVRGLSVNQNIRLTTKSGEVTVLKVKEVSTIECPFLRPSVWSALERMVDLGRKTLDVQNKHVSCFVGKEISRRLVSFQIELI